MTALQNAVESNTKSIGNSNAESSDELAFNESQLRTLANLRNCVQSAASVVSSASTTLGVDPGESFSVKYGSEFGDVFPSQPGETMLRWISSNTVYEFEDHDVDSSAQSGQRRISSGDLPSTVEEIDSEQSDSDNDLEVEIIQASLVGRVPFFSSCPLITSRNDNSSASAPHVCDNMA